MTRVLSIAATGIMAVSYLTAQSTQSMTANIRGGGGDEGKCTIEVEVDSVAEVEVRGDRAFIRTLQGQPSTFRRFECNSVLPRNPVDFRFKGIDGRGRVNLVQDPASRGVAVVRIEDSQGGREGYTFDLLWRGGSDTYRDDRSYRDDRTYRDDRRYGNNDRIYRDDRGRRNSDSLDDRLGGYDMTRAVNVCQDAVRTRARRDYGIRNLSFRSANADDLRGNRDRVEGEFEGNRGDWYQYSCTVNTVNGNIRNVDIRRR